MGLRPGGCVGVFLSSDGTGGGGPEGGGDIGEAYGFVMYDASDVIEGIGSRKTAFPDLCRLWPLLSFDDPLEDRFDCPMLSFGDLSLDEELPELRAWLIGGELWKRQNTW